jgi:hypothetical protein
VKRVVRIISLLRSRVNLSQLVYLVCCPFPHIACDMIAQGLVRTSDGWARVERSPSLRSGIESPLNHPFMLFLLNLLPQPTVIALNIIIAIVFRGWHRRHPIGFIVGRLIITCFHRILLHYFHVIVHVTSWEVPMHCPFGLSSRWTISRSSFTSVNITSTFLPPLNAMRT